jgi:hypothetical protein
MSQNFVQPIDWLYAWSNQGPTVFSWDPIPLHWKYHHKFSKATFSRVWGTIPEYFFLGGDKSDHGPTSEWAGFCPGLLECLHFFNQIQANNTILYYFMVRFIQRLSGGFFCWVVVGANQCRPAGAEHWVRPVALISSWIAHFYCLLDLFHTMKKYNRAWQLWKYCLWQPTRWHNVVTVTRQLPLQYLNWHDW